jgi:hypothetical protein
VRISSRIRALAGLVAQRVAFGRNTLQIAAWVPFLVKLDKQKVHQKKKKKKIKAISPQILGR